MNMKYLHSLVTGDSLEGFTYVYILKPFSS